MTTPTFVNVGQTSGSFATSKTAVMPASIVAGNLLIGFLSLNLTAGATPSWPAGWTVAYLYNTSGFTISIAWKIAVGGDAAPTVTWTGNTDVQLSVAQYTGNDTTSPIGNIADNPHPSGGTTAVAGTAVTTANANSTVATWCMLNNTGSVTVEPSGSWTKEINSTALHLVMYDTPMVSAGAAPSFALTFSASILYDVIEVEIKSPTPTLIPTTTHAVGVSQSSTLTLEADLSASFAMGFATASTFEQDQFLSLAPALGVAQAVVLTLEADLAAAMLLGVSQAGAPESAQELTPAPAALGFDTAVTMSYGTVEGGTHGVGISTAVALSFQRLLSPSFSIGLAQALSPGLITLPAKDIQIAWLRRDRLGGSPRFVQDNVPMSEATEAYDVEIIVAGQVARTFAGVTTNSVVYTAAMQIADGWTQPPIQLSVRVFQLSAVVGRGYGEIITVDVG